jgi:hypothetical protein
MVENNVHEVSDFGATGSCQSSRDRTLEGAGAKGALPSDGELYGWVSYSLEIVHGPGISSHDDMNDSTFYRMSATAP